MAATLSEQEQVSSDTIVSNSISETRNSLLLRLPDKTDIDAWDQFIDIYQPLVFRLARSKGFQEADAHDIVQEVKHLSLKLIGRERFMNFNSVWISSISRTNSLEELRSSSVSFQVLITQSLSHNSNSENFK